MVVNSLTLATIRTSSVLFLRLLVQAISLFLVARMLGPQHFGAFSGVGALAVLFGTLSSFGTHLVLLSEVSRDPKNRTSVLVYALPTITVNASLLLLIHFLLCLIIFNSSSINWSIILAIGLAEIFLQPFIALAASEILALEKAARSQLIQIAPLFLRLVVAIIVFSTQPSDILTVYVFGYLLVTLIALYVGAACLPEKWPSPRVWKLPTLNQLKTSSAFAFLNITALGPTELDKVMAVNLLSFSAAGVYSAGARIIGAVTLPVIALMISVMPRLFREGGENKKSTKKLLKYIFSACFFYSMCLSFVLWWIAPYLVWFFGVEYDGVDDMVRWLCIAIPGMAIRIAAGNMLMALGQPWMRFIFELTGLLILSFASVVLTNRLGIIGMPLALACAEWMMCLLGVFLLRRDL